MLPSSSSSLSLHQEYSEDCKVRYPNIRKSNFNWTLECCMYEEARISYTITAQVFLQKFFYSSVDSADLLWWWIRNTECSGDHLQQHYYLSCKLNVIKRVRPGGQEGTCQSYLVLPLWFAFCSCLSQRAVLCRLASHSEQSLERRSLCWMLSWIPCRHDLQEFRAHTAEATGKCISNIKALWGADSSVKQVIMSQIRHLKPVKIF